MIPGAPGRLAADKVYVIHVRTGAEDRAASIEAQLRQRGIAFEYVLEGDMEDLEPVLLDRYFTGMMKRVHPKTSCCCKHIIAYSRMMRDGHQSALILEDDIQLSADFVEALNASVAELRARDDARPDTAVISLENSGLTPVVSTASPASRSTGPTTGAAPVPTGWDAEARPCFSIALKRTRSTGTPITSRTSFFSQVRSTSGGASRPSPNREVTRASSIRCWTGSAVGC